MPLIPAQHEPVRIGERVVVGLPCKVAVRRLIDESDALRADRGRGDEKQNEERRESRARCTHATPSSVLSGRVADLARRDDAWRELSVRRSDGAMFHVGPRAVKKSHRSGGSVGPPTASIPSGSALPVASACLSPRACAHAPRYSNPGQSQVTSPPSTSSV